MGKISTRESMSCYIKCTKRKIKDGTCKCIGNIDNLSTQKSLIKDLEFQKESLKKERLQHNKEINLLTIKLNQLKYKVRILKDKEAKVSAEIYSQQNINKFR